MLDSAAPQIPDDENEFYPYYSQEPVTESDWHRIAIRYLEESLGRHFAERPDAYVSSNVFVYYEQGEKEKKVSPDVFVAFGSSKEQRSVHKNWVQGVPFAVFEITSESSRLADQGEKRVKYSVMGIQEYYLFDPLGEYLPGKLRVYRREGDELMPVVCSGDFESSALGLRFEVEDNLLRVYNLATGAPYLTSVEKDETIAAKDETIAAKDETIGAKDKMIAESDGRIRRLEEEVRRLREH